MSQQFERQNWPSEHAPVQLSLLGRTAERVQFWPSACCMTFAVLQSHVPAWCNALVPSLCTFRRLPPNCCDLQPERLQIFSHVYSPVVLGSSSSWWPAATHSAEHHLFGETITVHPEHAFGTQRHQPAHFRCGSEALKPCLLQSCCAGIMMVL